MDFIHVETIRSLPSTPPAELARFDARVQKDAEAAARSTGGSTAAPPMLGSSVMHTLLEMKWIRWDEGLATYSYSWQPSAHPAWTPGARQAGRVLCRQIKITLSPSPLSPPLIHLHELKSETSNYLMRDSLVGSLERLICVSVAPSPSGSSSTSKAEEQAEVGRHDRLIKASVDPSSSATGSTRKAEEQKEQQTTLHYTFLLPAATALNFPAFQQQEHYTSPAFQSSQHYPFLCLPAANSNYTFLSHFQRQ
eukprot:gene17804-24182_t